jgi:hypothetical protein
MIKKISIGLLLPIIASAQWSSNSSINNAICTNPYNQQNPKIVEDGNGGAIIVWEDYRNDPTQTIADIYAQRIDKNGIIKWATNGIVICNASGHQSNPNIDYANGKVVIVWNDTRNGNKDIYAQLIDTSGNILWTANGVPVINKPYSQIDGKVAISTNGNVYVVYQDSSAGNWDIYAQKLNNSGVQQWGTNGAIVCNAGFDQKNPRLELASSGGIYVVWQDRRNGADYDIYCQKLNESGNRLWNAAANGYFVCSTPGTQNNPKIEPFGPGFLVVWQDNRTGGGYDIYAQYVNDNGLSQWNTNGKVICNAFDNQSALDVKSTGSSAYIVWKDFRNGLNYDIYMQRIDINGNALWTNNGIAISTAIYDQINPNLAVDGTNAYVVWQDSSSNDWNIYAAKVAPNGNILWNTIVCNATDNQTDAKNVYDGSGGTIVVWKDKRNNSLTKWDIYAQKVFSNGSLNNVSELNKDVFKTKIWPNPAKDELNIQLFNTFQTDNQIIIENMMGQIILSKQIKFSNEKIDISELQSGVYILKVKTNEEILSISKFIKQ